MAGHATVAPLAQSERTSNNLDSEGWRIPLPPWPPSSSHSDAERTNHIRIAGILRSHGWLVTEYPRAYSRDGGRFVPDLLVQHPDTLAVPGVIEVKAQIGTVRDFADAAKQAIDYTHCKELATGRRIGWAAVYPFCPKDDKAMAEMFGALSFSGVAFKCGAFIDGDYAKEAGLISLYRREDLLFFYKREQRIWSTESGFVADASNMLLGKRKIGGQRLCRPI